MAVTTSSIQETVSALVRNELPVAEVREHLRHPAALVRVNALQALVKYASDDDDLVHDIAAAAVDPQNAVRLMGTITVGHVAVGCLHRVGTAAALEAAAELETAWAAPDRDDLFWYLRSEGYQIA